MPLRVGWWALALAVSLLVLGAPAARVHLRSERELPGLSALLAGPRDYHIDAQADIEDAADSAPALEYPLPTLDGVHLLTLKPAAKMQAPSAKVAPEPRFTPDWAGHKGADFSDGASAALGEDVPSANDADASLRADQRSLERSYDSNFHNGFYKAEKEIFMLGRLTPKKHDPEYLNRLSDVFAKPKAVGNISPVGVRAIEPVHFEGGINVPSKRLPMHHSFSTRNPAADTASSFAGAAQGSYPSSAYPSGLPSAASRSSPGAPSSAGPSSAAESSASRILDVVKDVNPYNLFGSSPSSSWADRIASEQTRAAPRPSRPSRASTSTSRGRPVSPATARALPVHVSIVPMPRGQLIARNKRLLDVFHPPKPKPRVPLFRPRARRSSSSSQSEEEIDWHDTAITSKFGKDPLYDSSMRQAMREYKEDLIRAQATLPLQRGEELSDPREQARQQQEQLDYRRLEAEDLQRQRDEQQLLNAGAHNDSDTEPDHLFSQSEQLPVNQRTRSLEATAIPRSESAESRAFPASASSSGAPRPSAAPAASSAPTPSRKSVLPSLGDYSALIRGAKTNPSGRFDDPAAPFTGSNLKRIVGGLGVPSAGALESQYAAGAGGADSAMTGVLGVVGQQLAGMGIPNILAAPTSSVPSIGNPVPNAHAAMQPGWQPGLDTESLSRLGMLGPRSSDREFDHSFGGVVDSLINGLATMYANNGVDLQQAAQATAAAAQGLPTPVAPNQYELGNRAAPASNPYFTSRPQFVDQQGRPLYLSPQHVQQLQAQMAPGERLSDYALPSNYQSNSSPGAFRR